MEKRMKNLKYKLKDHARRTKIMEQLAQFVGWNNPEPGVWFAPKDIVYINGEIWEDENPLIPFDEPFFDPLDDTPQGAWDFEMVKHSLDLFGYTLELHSWKQQVTADVVLGPLRYQVIATGHLAERYAVCECVIVLCEEIENNNAQKG